MCVGAYRTYEPGVLQAELATEFAEATLSAYLDRDAFESCVGVGSALSELTTGVGVYGTELMVSLHRDHVELMVCGLGVMKRRTLYYDEPLLPSSHACELP